MPNSARHPIRRDAVRVIVGAFLGAVVVAAPAAAHTALESSSPADGARVGAAPDQVLLDFTEPVRARLSRVVVRGPAGERFESGPPTGVADKVVQPLRPLGGPGGYQIAYRVVAVDGHALTGSVRFTLTRPGPGVTRIAEPSVADRARTGGTPANRVVTGRTDLLPAWAFVTAVIAAAVIVTGAAWYGRRVTDDLD